MKKQYNVVVTERQSVARSKRLRESGQSSSGAVFRSAGGSGDTIIVNGSAALETDVTSNAAKTGHIDAGQKLPKGMTLTQFVKALLFKPVPATLVGTISTGNEVEYGTTKGQITYTAIRNGNGDMKSAYYDDKAENKLAFSAESNGVQTAIRKLSGIYTERETYKATAVYTASEDKSIPETTLTNTISVNVRRRWFAGVVNAVPTSSAQVRALSASGLYTGAGNYSFTISNYKTFIICIPGGTINEVTLKRYVYNFMDLDSAATPQKINVEGVNGSAAIVYTMYVFSSKTASKETDDFTFKTT